MKKVLLIAIIVFMMGISATFNFQPLEIIENNIIETWFTWSPENLTTRSPHTISISDGEKIPVHQANEFLKK